MTYGVNEVVFCIAGYDDIEELVKLVNGAYRGKYAEGGWTNEAYLLTGSRVNHEIMESLIGIADSQVLKAMIAPGVMAGCVHMKKSGDYLELGMLTVDPTLQRFGLGTLFLEKAEAYALQQGLYRILITVISKRTELISWYQRRGFVLNGEKKPFHCDPRLGIPIEPLEFLVMTKSIVR